VAETKPTLLVVEDDIDVADMLSAYFRAQGYNVITVYGGEEAVRVCSASRLDLIILDIRLPDIDGYEVARRVRSRQRTQDIPIIFLTEKRERSDRLQGLEVGGDDYITKPFDIQELRLRVRNALHRSTQGTLTNPITGLPEGPLVDERLLECLEGDGWAILRISLENLDEFREAYGFVAADDVQRAVSLMIKNAIRGVGSPNDFVGQLSSTDFILVTVPTFLPALVDRIRSRLMETLEFFYPLKDREQNAIQGKRLGVQLGQLFPGEGPFSGLDRLKAELMAHYL
jgi:DNA-binding response OmpR family regulator